MKKIKLILLSVISLFISIFINDNAHAETSEYLTVEKQENVFYAMTNDDGYFSADPFSYYSMNGKTVYCIEQGVRLDTNYYVGSEGYVNSPFSDVINRQIELIGHYGYDYPGHQTQKYRMATQALIWETITGNNVNFFTENYGWGDHIDISYERQQIMNLVNNHYIKPSFDGKTFNAILNQEIEIEDNNYRINEFEVYNSNGNDVRIDKENNKVYIIPKKIGITSIQFNKRKYDSGTTFFYVASDGYSQKLAFFRSNDPVATTVNLNVLGGKIKLVKYDSETKSCKAQGSANLVGAKYGVYDSSNNLLDTLIIGEDCTATSKELAIGNYKVKEISASTGYEIDTTVYDVNITNTNTIEVVSEEDVIKGKIKITKHDSETNSCSSLGQATLVGAKYGVYDSNDNLVDTLIIGEDCTATSKDLVFGQYKIKELSAAKGYTLDTKVYSVDINSTTVVNVVSKEDIIKGKIKITKHDSETNSCKSLGQATLVSAKYGVYDSSNNLLDTLIIGEDCTATSKDLPFGIYTIKEISAPKGYKLDTKVYSVDINSTTVVNVVLKEDVIKGKIKITKHDSETNSCKSQGQATLVGAKYGVYDSNDNLVDTLIIGEDCTATSKDLVFGQYKIKELSASKGYTLDTKTYNVDINSTIVVNVVSKEDIIKNYISILKQYEYVDGNSTLLKAESNITFEIYSTNGKKLTEVTTNKNGYAKFELPYGIWKFHQKNTKSGYLKVNDFEIIVDENSEKQQYYNILNNKISAYLKVFKIDADTKQVIALANTTFKILNLDTNEYVTQYVGGKLLSEFKTDENGQFVTYLKLYAGHYRLVEISSPKNYILNENGLDFVIDDETSLDYDENGAFITLYFEDQVIKGQIEIFKDGEIFSVEDGMFNYNDREKLKGIVYNIYAEEDILSSDNKQLYYHKGDLVETITTNENGYAISSKLPLGKYCIKEIKTLDNYVLDETEYHIELTEKDNKTAIVYKSLKLTNKLKKGKLEFTKTDLVTGDVIPNTIIEIYTENDELIFTGTTDEYGKITIDELKVGKYYIIEKEASTGYVITTEKVFFEILEDGEIAKVEMKNKSITGKLEFTKVDYSTNEPIPNTLIEIYSVDDEENPIFSGRTDENGKIVIDELKYGKYYILEKETASPNYVLNTEKMYFEILEDGEIVKCTMVNELTPIEVPNTEIEDSHVFEFVGGLLILFGLGGAVYAIKKKRK